MAALRREGSRDEAASQRGGLVPGQRKARVLVGRVLTRHAAAGMRCRFAQVGCCVPIYFFLYSSLGELVWFSSALKSGSLGAPG